jgi:hypothetical protein
MKGIPVQLNTCSACQTEVPFVDSAVTEEPVRLGPDTWKYQNIITDTETGSQSFLHLYKG